MPMVRISNFFDSRLYPSMDLTICCVNINASAKMRTTVTPAVKRFIGERNTKTNAPPLSKWQRNRVRKKRKG